jgi:hypothetical protein
LAGYYFGLSQKDLGIHEIHFSEFEVGFGEGIEAKKCLHFFANERRSGTKWSDALSPRSKSYNFVT